MMMNAKRQRAREIWESGVLIRTVYFSMAETAHSFHGEEEMRDARCGGDWWLKRIEGFCGFAYEKVK
jgi:hypothetical protein